MKKELWADMLGCAIGALIGGLIALEIQSRLILGEYLWIFGAFIGGAIGWCAGELKELRIGIARSYRASKENLSRELKSVMKWRPDWEYWKASLMLIARLTVSFISSISLMGVIDFFASGKVSDSLIGFPFLLYCTLILGCAFFVSIILVAVLIALPWFKKKGRDEFEVGWIMFKYFNPIVLPFACVVWIFMGLRNAFLFLKENGEEIASIMKIFMKETWKFFVRIFVYAHSERRRIRFIGAFFGTVAGFFLGSAILGAVVGAIVGGISREYIAIRWLKLIPAKT